jgi:hypothetical protein
MMNQFAVKDDKGNVVRGTNGEVVYKSPTSLNEMRDLANILDQGGSDGHMAAQELRAKAPILGSLKGPGKEDTQRADLETMGLMAAAQGGRLEGSDIATIRNRTVDANNKRIDGLPGLADKRTARLLQLSSNQRQDLREGHGIHFDNSGRAYSVFDKDHYNSAEAKANLFSIKGTAMAASKAETVRAMSDSIKHFYTNGSESEKDILLNTIAYGGKNIYTDPGQQQAWLDIANDLGIPEDALKARADAQARDPVINQEMGAMMNPPQEGAPPQPGQGAGA